MTEHLNANIIRYGSASELPERRVLHAGPVTAVLENADLRYVRFGDTLIILRLYVAIRNRNWDTIEPAYSDFAVDDRGDSFEIRFNAENVAGDVDFAWSGRITGSADGTIRYEMDGAPRKPFLRNRIGFCVLHPMELGGMPASVETPDGQVDGAFPALISPNQPFIDMISIAHPAGGNGQATIRFEGDLFEMEDQRNWTDASFKTYSTPLRLPYPAEVKPTDRIVQSVTISVSGEPSVSPVSDSRTDVAIEPNATMKLPSIGFGAGGKRLIDADQIAQLDALQPEYLWAQLDLGDSTWREKLTGAAANVASLNVHLDLSVIGGPGETGWNDLAAAIADQGIRVGCLFVFPPPTSPMVFPRADLVTHAETFASAKRAFAGTEIAIGGGARTFFTELNRGVDVIPFDDLAVVTYPINPQVHAIDTLSVIENIAAQAATVISARAIIGEKPLMVGPITFKMLSNPNATESPPGPGPDQLPDSVDPRQLSLFGAGWTVGSLHQLGAAGADALTYYELIGWRGLTEQNDGLTRRELFPSIARGLFPMYHVFAAVASMAGGSLIRVMLEDELMTEALALRDGDRILILVANLTNERRSVRVALPGVNDVTLRVLDEETYVEAATNPAFFTDPGQPIAVSNVAQINLAPFAVACLKGEL